MIRSPNIQSSYTPSPSAGFGFDNGLVAVSSPRLTKAVAASLAVGAVSVCLIVALTMLSIGASIAMPLPA